MKDSKTILLLILSVCLVVTWGYHIYDKNKNAENVILPEKKDTVAVQRMINDSIKRAYAAALVRLGSAQIDKDSINSELMSKVSESDSLRKEIDSILHVANITKEDLKKAEEKIALFELKLTPIKKGQKISNNNIVQRNNSSVVDDKRQVTEKNAIPVSTEVTSSGWLSATPILKAVQQSDSEQATTKADATESFIVNCTLQNSYNSFTDTDVYFVLTGPGGRIIQDDQWQAGMFSAGNGTRIPYTRKSKINYSKGELKKITVKIKPGQADPGIYSIQVYHNGRRIGKADVRLN